MLSPVATIAAQQLAGINAVGVTAGSPVTDAQRLQVLEALYQPVYTDLTTNAMVAPGSFVVPSGPSAGPIAGLGGPLE